jgi:hypothetical protein
MSTSSRKTSTITTAIKRIKIIIFVLVQQRTSLRLLSQIQTQRECTSLNTKKMNSLSLFLTLSHHSIDLLCVCVNTINTILWRRNIRKRSRSLSSHLTQKHKYNFQQEHNIKSSQVKYCEVSNSQDTTREKKNELIPV